MKSGVSGYRKLPSVHVAEDVARVRAEAFLVLEFSKDPESPTVTENPDGMYNVIAVIGPGTGLPGTPAAGQSFDKALLCEIGISRGRPYAASFRWDKNSGTKRSATHRRKWFQISPADYKKALGAILFHYLQFLADVRIEKWKDPVTYVRVPTAQLHRLSNEVVEGRGQWSRIEKGARFTVSAADSELVTDLYAYVLADRQLEESVVGLTNLMDLQLDRYRGGFTYFKRLKAAANLRDVLDLSPLPRILKMEAISRLPDRTRRMFGSHLAALLHWNGKTPPLLERARNSQDFHARINGSRFRLVREKRGLIVVEFFASPDVKSRMLERLVS